MESCRGMAIVPAPPGRVRVLIVGSSEEPLQVPNREVDGRVADDMAFASARLWLQTR